MFWTVFSECLVWISNIDLHRDLCSDTKKRHLKGIKLIFLQRPKKRAAELHTCKMISYVFQKQRNDDTLNNEIYVGTRHETETFFPCYCSLWGEFTSQRQVTQSFNIFFDLRLNKRLSKQSERWWFETPSRSLWRHCNFYRCWYGCVESAHFNSFDSIFIFISCVREG